MTPTVTGPALRPLPRFTFAGRGCRDPRREPRSLPHSLRLQPPCPPTTMPSPVPSEPGRPSAGRSSTTEATGHHDDRPPPVALRYGPAPWQIPTGLWSSSAAAMPS